MASAGILFLALSSSRAAPPQKPPPKRFTLDQAVVFALSNYPAIRVRVERLVAKKGEVELAKTAFLPRTDTLWQSNRATANNIYGLLLPQGVLPPISGPVLASTTGRSVWGSGAGVLFSWEAFDFGYRRAEVNIARAGEQRARAEAELTRLDVGTAAANAFLSLLANEQVVRAAQANVRRWEVFDKSAHVLVDNQLRPGADASRADAELALARNRLIQAETSTRVSRAAFADMLGISSVAVEVDPGRLLVTAPQESLPALPLSSHPAAAAEHAQVEQTKAQERAVERSYVPRFFTQASLSGRGSGANPDGTLATGLNGLGLERANYAAGVTVTFPAFDYFSLRAKRKIAAADHRAEQARYEQLMDGLSDQVEQAQAELEGARRIAENTPIELEAARSGETQAQARYQAGLATIVELAEAEGLLVQAEIDDALARLNVWRGLGDVASAQGDLEPFLQLLGGTGP
jgi:outer membrane protein